MRIKKARRVISLNPRFHARLIRWLLNEHCQGEKPNDAILRKLYGLMREDKEFNRGTPRKEVKDDK